MNPQFRHCFVDESVYSDHGFVVSAFVFGSRHVAARVRRTLGNAGLRPGVDEFKSGARMQGNVTMQRVREELLCIANTTTRIAVFVGEYERGTIGRHTLQALQSIVVRNAIKPSRLRVYFDQDIFSSQKEARRLHTLFHYLRAARIYPSEDSRSRLGIQIADVVAASFGQIIKEAVTGAAKEVDIGGPQSGYEPGTTVPLGWSLLMSLRNALLTRPVVYGGDRYAAAADPVILDRDDDPVIYGQYPTLLGWGIQIAPSVPDELRHAVERSLGRIWLGCVH